MLEEFRCRNSYFKDTATVGDSGTFLGVQRNAVFLEGNLFFELGLSDG